GSGAVIVVADATCLERNLNLVLQILEITGNAVLCVNLLDEAEKKKIRIDLPALSALLGIPVIGACARKGAGLAELKSAVSNIALSEAPRIPRKMEYGTAIEKAVSILEPAVKSALSGRAESRWVTLKLLDGEESILSSLNRYLSLDILKNEAIAAKLSEAKEILEQSGLTPDRFRNLIISRIIKECEKIGQKTVRFGKEDYAERDRVFDRFLTSKLTGIPVMLLLLFFVLWLTIAGANYPSELISNVLFSFQDRLRGVLISASVPDWIYRPLIDGVYRTLAWVVSVMLPPMMIFFPLFTLLEDSGYLPRIAFNLDNVFRKAGAHGKQALTMCMGFGCNAAGVTGCRIVDSPRERMIAIATNNFAPCNGRFPTLIAVITMYFAGAAGGFKTAVSALMLTGVIVLGVLMTFLVSKLLSKTLLRGMPSSFHLELPPYRRPQYLKVIVRSVFDRTLFVLSRAVTVAAPAGLIIWLMANLSVNGISLLASCASFLDPFARFLGLDGYILFAFVLGFPANEIVIPIVIMGYVGGSSLTGYESLAELRLLLSAHGWTWLTALCTMLFMLMHWPCGTTCLTIRKETKSLKWTLLSAALPTAAGFIVCFAVASCARLLGLA
ncbi:MAG: ferrous iron transporter B, partial [Bacillota bacterium]|nr:ferrous iron transporter B [Bacillota bacterium]